MSDARVFQINVSQGGVPKRPVARAVVAENGILGDAVTYTKVHGGPDRALCIYSLERILGLQREGHPAFPGALGENITTTGLHFDEVEPGDRFAIGEETLVEVASYTVPCKTIAPWFVDGDSMRIHQERRPGWSRVYARVLRGGAISVGMPIVRA